MMEKLSKSPFKFLDSYTQADRDIFFGRDREIEEIYSKVFQSKLLLVYGASGTGKSSIINCGLANKFEESDWLPIHIRRGGNIRRSLFNQIQKEAVNKVVLSPEEENEDTGLEKALNSVFLDHFKPIYLIFDQFEELFIFGFKDEWQNFISSIRYLMEGDLDVHFLFVIRGEYLEFLSEFEDAIPEFFDNRVRVEKMTRKNASESIRGPIQLFPIDMEEGFEEKLLKKLSPEKSHIELTFLQVFLDKIYKRAQKKSDPDGRIQFTKEQIDRLGQMEDVLAEFVDEQLFNMPDSKAALTVLKSFVSLQGTKTLKSPEEILEYSRDIGQDISQEKIESIIAEFVNKRILKDHDDNDRYELRHDSLAQKIFEKITIQERELLDIKQFLSYSFNEYEKRGTLLKDEDLSYIGPHERSLKLDTQMMEFIRKSRQNSSRKRKQRKTRAVIALIMAGLLITSLLGLYYSLEQKKKAEESTLVAQRESSIAQEQRSIAEKQSAEAKRQALIAEQEKLNAEASSEEALRQKTLAENQRALAEQERLTAEQARKSAISSEQEARNQELLANQQHELAHKLRMLSLSREMAIKSTHLIDPELKGLLALQAYSFNNEFGGKSFQPEIYDALYSARKSLSTDQFNADKTHNQVIKTIISLGDGIYSAGNDGKITKTVWEGSSPKTKTLLETGLVIESMSLSSDQKFAVLGTHQGEVVYINLDKNEILFNAELHNSEIVQVLFQSDQIISVDQDGTTVRQNLSGQILKTSELGGQIVSVSPNHELFWVGLKNGTIQSLDQNNQVINQIETNSSSGITSIEIDTKNQVIAIGFRNGTVTIWDLNLNQPVQVLPGHAAAITSLAFDSSGEYLISGSFDRSVRLWSLKESEQPPIVIQDHDSWVSSVTFDDGGQYFYSGVFGGVQRRFAINTQTLTQGLCEKIGRNMTQEEWNKYVGEDIDEGKTCIGG